MSLRKRFGTSKSLVEEGAWMEITENEDGTLCRLRVKRTNQQNTAFQKQLANHRKAYETDFYSERKIDQAQASMIEILAETVIVGWENVEDWETPAPTGPVQPPPVKLPYNKDNARRMLREFPDLANLVMEFAQDLTNYQKKEEIKN